MAETETDLLGQVLARTHDVLAGVRPEQLGDPTPCADLDVAALVDHVVGWSVRFDARLNERPGADDLEPYVAGPDPAAEFRRAADGILEALTGATPAPEQLSPGFLCMEFIAHGWDLATATGQPTDYPPAAAELALGVGRQMLKPEYRGAGQSFGPEVDAGGDAAAVERLVAFLGRDPKWAPPRT